MSKEIVKSLISSTHVLILTLNDEEKLRLKNLLMDYILDNGVGRHFSEEDIQTLFKEISTAKIVDNLLSVYRAWMFEHFNDEDEFKAFLERLKNAYLKSSAHPRNGERLPSYNFAIRTHSLNEVSLTRALEFWFIQYFMIIGLDEQSLFQTILRLET